MKIYKDDYVIIKNGEPVEPLHAIYHKTSLEDAGQLNKGEEWVSMTKLPKHLLDRYKKYLISEEEFDK